MAIQGQRKAAPVGIDTYPSSERMKYGRLKKTWEFDKVYRWGTRYFSDLFILYVLPNNTKEIRLGLTVSKKVGISVQRNRIKRIVREVFRSLEGARSGNDLVVIARRAATDMKYSQAQDTISHLLRRAGILKS